MVRHLTGIKPIGGAIVVARRTGEPEAYLVEGEVARRARAIISGAMLHSPFRLRLHERLKAAEMAGESLALERPVTQITNDPDCLEHFNRHPRGAPVGVVRVQPAERAAMELNRSQDIYPVTFPHQVETLR